MRYVMLICNTEDAWSSDPHEADRVMGEIGAWMAKWRAAGKIGNGGSELESVTTARTVTRGADGQPVVTDGPYLELKEVVGGYIELEADDLDDAVAVAATWPGIAAFADKVEVRGTR